MPATPTLRTASRRGRSASDRPLAAIATAIVVGVGLALGACGSAEHAAVEPSAEAAPAASYRPAPACRTAQDCEEKGSAAMLGGGGDVRELFRLACEKGSVQGCVELGTLYATGQGGPEDRPLARATLEPLCPAQAAASGASVCTPSPLALGQGTCVVDACARLVELTPADASELRGYAQRGCSLKGSQGARSAAARAAACLVFARAVEAGPRPADARSPYQTACALGSNEACGVALSALDKPAPAQPEAQQEGSLEMPSVDTDGLVMRNVSCTMAADPIMGILGGLTVGAGFAERKAALARCSPKPFRVELSWLVERHRVTAITADTADAKLKACVEKTLRSATGVSDGRCKALLLVGPQ